jgi:uncharacterized membrane protein YdfJ with MMPL/SSD domain
VIGILFGLAMDYQVFLVSRMHEAHATAPRRWTPIRTGFRQAAPVVVAAALIMFSVFAGFVPAGEATITSIAFALAVGILVDAFVVRMVLVPGRAGAAGRAGVVAAAVAALAAGARRRGRRAGAGPGRTPRAGAGRATRADPQRHPIRRG